MICFRSLKLGIAIPAALSLVLSATPPSAAQSGAAGKAGLTAVAASNNQFAIDLYRNLNGHETEKNIFVSPFSISTALAMTYEGSSGNTRKQMAAVLHFDEPDAERQAGYSALLDATKSSAGEHYQLEVANALWAQKDRHFEASFLKATEQYYGGALNNVDFAGDTEGARVRINTWVENHTAKMIRDLIPKGAIEPDTPLVLTNAIYFKGNWAAKFDKDATTSEAFYVNNSQTVQTPMMHQTEHFRFVREDGLAAIELPYADRDLSMIVILPGDAGKLGVELTLGQFEKLCGDMRSQEVEVWLPRFSLEASYSLKSTLSEMGMPDAFSERLADFTAMTGSPDLYIGKVIHKAKIEVNEEGSEAAAGTAVIMAPKSMPIIMKEEFRADRPFLFFIAHNSTGAILFMGRVSNPAAKD